MSDKFEPIYLQDAKRHIDWLYDKIKKTSHLKQIEQPKRSLFSRVISWLKDVF